MIVLKGRHRSYFPEKVEGIKVEKKAKKLYFLHSVAWGKEGEKFTYIVHYNNGETKEIEVRYGSEFRDWCDERYSVKNAKIAWTGTNPLSPAIAVYCYCWENPNKEEIIKTIDIKSHNMDVVPGIMGITGETE
jgi:hypothetical protein